MAYTGVSKACLFVSFLPACAALPLPNCMKVFDILFSRDAWVMDCPDQRPVRRVGFDNILLVHRDWLHRDLQGLQTRMSNERIG